MSPRTRPGQQRGSGRLRPARTASELTGVIGWTCVLIGVGHLIGGSATVAGEAGTSATVDSRERFYGAVFAGYGVAWVWAARQRPVPQLVVTGLCGVMGVGGLGRLLSRVTRGRPHWFQDVLTTVELTLPAVVVLLVAKRPGRRATRFQNPRVIAEVVVRRSS